MHINILFVILKTLFIASICIFINPAMVQGQALNNTQEKNLRSEQENVEPQKVEHAINEDGDRVWSLSMDTTYSSKYIWRGINLNNDPVIWPSLEFSYNGLTASIWSSIETTNYNKYENYGDTAGECTEVDLSINYSFCWQDLEFSIGAINYQYPNTGLDSTTELYGMISLKSFLCPTIELYKDIEEIDGIYSCFSINHSFTEIWQLSESVCMSIDLCASIGYGSKNHNECNYETSKATFTDYSLSLAIPVDVGDYWTITPSINYSSLLDKNIRYNMENDDNIWFSFSISLSF
ncbi:hypothetical protein ACFL54_02005 [Planctomycetota bacterium]